MSNFLIKKAIDLHFHVFKLAFPALDNVAPFLQCFIRKKMNVHDYYTYLHKTELLLIWRWASQSNY